MKSEGHGTLTFLGVVMIIFGLVYALLGTLSLMGTITGVLPGHEEQEIIIVILSYIIAILAIIGGISSVRGKYTIAKTISLIFAIVGLVSLIYNQVTQDTFNNFDCITMVLGAGIFYLATTAKKEDDQVKAIKEKKLK